MTTTTTIDLDGRATVTMQELAHMTGHSVKTLRGMADHGRLPTVQLTERGTRLVPVEVARHLLAEAGPSRPEADHQEEAGR